MKTQENSELKELFTNHLKTLYWSEKKLTEALPDMADAATSSQLKNAFTKHLNETRQHVSRLEQVFSIIGEEPDAEKCKIMSSITDAGDKTISNTSDGSAVRDAGLTFGAQLAEHYEIASYGNMIAIAKSLDIDEAADIMSQTLEEEKQADALLTQIRESEVNAEAQTF